MVLMCGCVAAILAAGPVSVQAATYSWAAVSPSDWSLPANWSGGTSVPASGDTAYIVNGGTAAVTTTGDACGTLSLGSTAGTGTVQMTAGGIFANGSIFVGYSGTGTFIQSGGNAGLFGYSFGFYVGYNSGSSGTYNLSGTGQFSSNSDEYVGCSGSGTFLQSGGTNSTGNLYIGRTSGGSGTYSLSETGRLSVANLCVGGSGTGTFNQFGGTIIVPYAQGYNNAFYLGGAAGGSGTYNLSGGQLSAPNEYLASNAGGTALFNQTGGVNTTTYNMSIGSSGCYQFSGGTLQINGGLVNAGVFDGGSSPATLLANCIVDLTAGTWQNLGSTTFTLGSSSLLIVPAGFNPLTGLAGNSTFGLIHTAGTTLVVPAGQGFAGSGTINDPVNCQGMVTASSGGSINLGNGLTLAGTGTITLGGGSLTINDTASTMSGGSLYAVNQYVGNGGTGAFTQSGGTNCPVPPQNSGYAGYLYLGYNAADSGTYTLSGTGKITEMAFEYVGYSGTGNFAQSGGYHGASGLYLGYNSGSRGTYNLGGTGSMYAVTQYVGYDGNGSFTQTGGTNGSALTEWTSPLYLGFHAGGSGTYLLSGSGDLYATAEYVGYSGTGVFNQFGGSNVLTNIAGSPYQYGTAYLGFNAGSSATYTLSGAGQLFSHYEYVGYNAGAAALFQQSGGTNTTASLAIGNSGAYNLGGGILVASALSGLGSAEFNFNGGTLLAGSGFSTSLPMTLGTSGGNATFDTAGYGVTLSGPLSGPGNLVKADSGTLVLAASNTYSGTTLISGGTLALANSGALQQSTLDTGGGGVLSFGPLGSATLGGLTGPGALSLTNTTSAAVALSVGSNNNSTTFSGIFQGAGSLTKVGSGTLTLAGSNAYSGGTSINQGSVIVAGSLGNTAVTVGGGARLGGTGSIAGTVVVLGGATPSTQGAINLADGMIGTLTLSDPNAADTVLTLGGLTVGNPSVFTFEVGAIADRILVTAGKVVVNPGGSLIGITALPGFGPGTYDLMDFPNGQASGLGNLTLGTPTLPGYALSLQSTPTAEQLVVAVPEPGTLALLAAGAIGLIAWTRRCRRASARLPMEA
jgi:autotransporter-associated beta strand protein